MQGPQGGARRRKAGQGGARPDKAGQGGARRGKAGQGGARHECEPPSIKWICIDKEIVAVPTVAIAMVEDDF